MRFYKVVMLQVAAVFLLVSGMTGCILVPFVQAFKETGLTEGDRMALLPPRIKKFSDARVFGNKTDALSVVADDSKVEIANQLQTGKERERIVKSQIDNVEWIDNAYKARVIVRVESFTMSQLVVQTLSEEQQWEFSSGSGWLLTSRTKLDA
jgi:hypothetical protein